jgi:hypothetical protein
MIDVYGRGFEFLGFIDNFVGVTVEKTYRNISKFNIDLNSFEYSDILQIDNYILFNNIPYIIKSVNHYKNFKNETIIKVAGFSIDFFLQDRVILNEFKVKEGTSYEELIYKIVKDNLIEPTNNKRQVKIIKNATFKNINSYSQSNYNMQNMSVREAITLLCSYSGLGYRINFKDSYFEFEVYQGRYLVDSVIFSDEFNNIADTELMVDEGNVKNVAYAIDEETNKIKELGFYNQIEETGLNRKEIILLEEDATRVTGVLNLSNDTLKVQALILPTKQFEYKIDWDLGDTVLFEDTHFNFTREQPILQIIEYLGANGTYELEIKLGEKKIQWQLK